MGGEIGAKRRMGKDRPEQGSYTFKNRENSAKMQRIEPISDIHVQFEQEYVKK